MDASISRRALALGPFGTILGAPHSYGAPGMPRLAVLDWSLDELALMLGAVPVAASEAAGYRTWVGTPVLPPTVIDLGLRAQPTLELLQRIRPDLILTIPERADVEAAVSRIAPTLSPPIFTSSCTPWDKARAAMLVLGERIGAREPARACLDAADARLDALRARLAGAAHRPITVIRFVDAHNLFVFTAGGLFADMLDRLGLENGYAAAPSYWGYVRVPLVALAAARPDTRLLYLDAPLPPDATTMMREDPLWRDLPFVRAGAVASLPTVWFFGAVGSALRFAEVLTTVLIGMDAARAG